MPRRFNARFSPSLAAVVVLAAASAGSALAAGQIGATGAGATTSADADERTFAVASQEDAGPRVFGRFKDGFSEIPNTTTDMLTVRLGAGNHVILAKADLQVSSFGSCRLEAGGDFDEAGFFSNGRRTFSMLSLTVLHASATSFTARLRCVNESGPNSTLRNIKLTALKVGRLRNLPG